MLAELATTLQTPGRVTRLEPKGWCVEDEQGFVEWAAGCERRLLRSAYLLTGDLHRAEDLVQEALVKVALRWKRLSGGNPTAYARTVIVHDHANWWRRRREVVVEHSAENAAVGDDPDAQLVVRRALARLTPRQRAVLVLRHFDDLTERETAEVLGVSVGTVRTRTQPLWPGFATARLSCST